MLNNVLEWNVRGCGKHISRTVFMSLSPWCEQWVRMHTSLHSILRFVLHRHQVLSAQCSTLHVQLYSAGFESARVIMGERLLHGTCVLNVWCWPAVIVTLKAGGHNCYEASSQCEEDLPGHFVCWKWQVTKQKLRTQWLSISDVYLTPLYHQAPLNLSNPIACSCVRASISLGTVKPMILWRRQDWWFCPHPVRKLSFCQETKNKQFKADFAISAPPFCHHIRILSKSPSQTPSRINFVPHTGCCCCGGWHTTLSDWWTV